MNRLPAFRKLCAREQLALLRQYPRLTPRLMGLGLAPEDARALAYNATLLFRCLEEPPPSPGAVLARYTLGEIAALCEAYRRVEAGELEYGYSEVTT